jgi:hypothetical protein
MKTTKVVVCKCAAGPRRIFVFRDQRLVEIIDRHWARTSRCHMPDQYVDVTAWREKNGIA